MPPPDSLLATELDGRKSWKLTIVPTVWDITYSGLRAHLRTSGIHLKIESYPLELYLLNLHCVLVSAGAVACIP